MIISVKCYFDLGDVSLDQEEILVVQETLQAEVSSAVFGQVNHVRGIGYTISLGNKKKVYALSKTWSQVQKLLKLQPSVKKPKLSGLSAKINDKVTKSKIIIRKSK